MEAFGPSAIDSLVIHGTVGVSDSLLLWAFWLTTLIYAGPAIGAWIWYAFNKDEIHEGQIESEDRTTRQPDSSLPRAA